MSGMDNGRDASRRGLSRRALLRGIPAALALPLVSGCTWLDAVEDERHTVKLTDQARFEPAGLTIPVGATVVWRNMDEQRHTVTGNPEELGDPNRVALPDGAEPWDSGDLLPGEQFTHTFTVPGTYVYACRYLQSEGMVGTVTVEAEN